MHAKKDKTQHSPGGELQHGLMKRATGVGHHQQLESTGGGLFNLFTSYCHGEYHYIREEGSELSGVFLGSDCSSTFKQNSILRNSWCGYDHTFFI